MLKSNYTIKGFLIWVVDVVFIAIDEMIVEEFEIIFNFFKGWKL